LDDDNIVETHKPVDGRAKEKTKINCSHLHSLIKKLESRLNIMENNLNLIQNEKNDLKKELGIKDKVIVDLTSRVNSYINENDAKVENFKTNYNSQQVIDLNSKLDEHIMNTNNRLNKNEMEATIKEVSVLKTTSYSDKVKNINENAVEIIKIAKKEQNETIKKENRVIIFGISSGDSSVQEEIDIYNNNAVNKLFNDLKMDSNKIKSHFRLKQKINIDKLAPKKSTPIIVELINKDEKLKLLKKSKNLRDIVGYDGVYINNDLTTNEREIFKQLIVERNALNEKDNTKDAKCDYYYGIRDFEVKKQRKKISKL
jgi:hypothetical protein